MIAETARATPPAPVTEEETAAPSSPGALPDADTPKPYQTIDHLLHPAPAPAKPLSGKFAAIDLGAPPPDVVNASADPLHPEGDPDAPSSADDDVTKLTRAERRVAAFNLRVAGNNYRDIAKHLGVSVKTVYYDVQQALQYLAKYERVLAEDVRAMQLARLDALTSFLWPSAENGDTYAVGQILNVMQRQAKLLGLDAPEEVNVNVRRPLREATLDDLRQLMETMREARPIPGAVLSTSKAAPLASPIDTAVLAGDQGDSDVDRDVDASTGE